RPQPVHAIRKHPAVEARGRETGNPLELIRIEPAILCALAAGQHDISVVVPIPEHIPEINTLTTLDLECRTELPAAGQCISDPRVLQYRFALPERKLVQASDDKAMRSREIALPPHRLGVECVRHPVPAHCM